MNSHPAPVIIELSPDIVPGLRREARRRECTVERLARELLDVIAVDGLVSALLDDAPADPGAQ